MKILRPKWCYIFSKFFLLKWIALFICFQFFITVRHILTQLRWHLLTTFIYLNSLFNFYIWEKSISILIIRWIIIFLITLLIFAIFIILLLEFLSNFSMFMTIWRIFRLQTLSYISFNLIYKAHGCLEIVKWKHQTRWHIIMLATLKEVEEYLGQRKQ